MWKLTASPLHPVRPNATNRSTTSIPIMQAPELTLSASVPAIPAFSNETVGPEVIDLFLYLIISFYQKAVIDICADIGAHNGK